jgi:predicted nucleic acid-binding protein
MKISVITNATPIIGLAYIGYLDLLNKLFDKIYVTQQVYDEVIVNEGSRIGSDELKNRIQEGLIILYKIIDNKFIDLMYGRLHNGELSVIVAAKELNINYVLIDDASARKTAESFSLVPIWIVGILKLAKIKGILSEVKPLLDKLIENNFRISLKLYNEILKDVNEI